MKCDLCINIDINSCIYGGVARLTFGPNAQICKWIFVEAQKPAPTNKNSTDTHLNVQFSFSVFSGGFHDAQSKVSEKKACNLHVVSHECCHCASDNLSILSFPTCRCGQLLCPDTSVSIVSVECETRKRFKPRCMHQFTRATTTCNNNLHRNHETLQITSHQEIQCKPFKVVKKPFTSANSVG